MVLLNKVITRHKQFLISYDPKGYAMVADFFLSEVRQLAFISGGRQRGEIGSLGAGH